MATNAGVWIDHKQAIVVFVSEAGRTIKKIALDGGDSGGNGGKSKATNRYTPKDFVPEDRIERKLENSLKNFYDEVIALIHTAPSILILGPGEAKGEFNKRIKSKKLHGVTIEMQTADKMTDPQLAAKVAAHFATVPSKSSDPSKQPAKKIAAKKITAKSTTVNRAKKGKK